MRTLPPFTKPALPALKPPTQAQIATVTDGLEYKWSHNALAIQDRLTQAVELGDAAQAQRWAIAAGISTDKVLVLKGRPTEIIANLHAHRHDMAPLMDKLSAAIKFTSARGFAPEPVAHAQRALVTRVHKHQSNDASSISIDAASNVQVGDNTDSA